MSYSDLVSIETDITLDTSNLDEALDEIRSRLDNIEGLDEDRVRDLIHEEGIDEDRVNEIVGGEVESAIERTNTALEQRLEALESKMAQVSAIRLALSQIVQALSEVGA